MSEFIENLEELLEKTQGSLQSTTLLSEITSWDSMAAVGFLALADAKYGIAVSPGALQKCKTIGDLAALVGQA